MRNKFTSRVTLLWFGLDIFTDDMQNQLSINQQLLKTSQFNSRLISPE